MQTANKRHANCEQTACNLRTNGVQISKSWRRYAKQFQFCFIGPRKEKNNVFSPFSCSIYFFLSPFFFRRTELIFCGREERSGRYSKLGFTIPF
ncbi:hypothetical protein POVWA2_038600 [Plasmodium ovale wallikeri]|uniref:Uncharacterized protein n=1 Tax=Plasmodium ovale wallikeri TaxID=864142 RepID=A0A1A8Z7Y1_PLAOA|nr:hypothetical protein POVWA2_038600 [Plasmodium ovale wallikeri]SBT42015.1 hypothetical protein POVWA1_045100 [Plasmodium ovale wallikeri]